MLKQLNVPPRPEIRSWHWAVRWLHVTNDISEGVKSFSPQKLGVWEATAGPGLLLKVVRAWKLGGDSSGPGFLCREAAQVIGED